MLKNDKIFENLGKNVKNLKIIRKREGDCVRLTRRLLVAKEAL